MPRTPYSLTAPALDATVLAAVVWSLDATWRWHGSWLAAAEAATTPVMFAAVWLFAASHIGVYRVPPRQDLRLALRREQRGELSCGAAHGLAPCA